MRLAAATRLLLLASVLVMTVSAGPFGADGFSHGTISCLQGIDGSGTRLHLTQHKSCDRDAEYPYLEIKIRQQQPIQANEKIAIGNTSVAFLCRSSRNSCQQFASGEILFEHFENSSEKGIVTNGWYQLKPESGLPETGRFKVDCTAPCG